MDPLNDRLSRIETLWSVVRRAHGSDTQAPQAAQQQLLDRYGGAVHRYALAALRNEDAADEVFQEFALRFVRGDFRSADPEKGRFRSFLKTTLYHLIVDYQRKKKRGAREAQLGTSTPEPVAATEEALEAVFDESWRDDLLARTWQLLESQEESSGKPYYTALKCRVDNPEARSPELAELLTARLGKPMKAGAARVLLHRAREAFADLLLDEVAHSLPESSLERVEEELIDLDLMEYCAPRSRRSLRSWKIERTPRPPASESNPRMPEEPLESKTASDQDPLDESRQSTLRQDLDEPRSSQRATIASGAPVSDVRLADDTLAAPSFRPPVKPNTGRAAGPTALEQGERLDDFEVVKVLGKGAFGVVYLARQLSLDRQVALKVAANEGSEGRTMARLEHDHIVQVFSESVDDSGTMRLLCMQLVAGASLEGIIHNLHRRDPERPEWNGKDYLAIVESRAQVTDVLDTSALRDRELLEGYDAVQTAAWVGARLAEAVDYAHKQGVLHRDIKPANILVNQYGRPMLADFNISFRSFDQHAAPDSTFGGTLAFMAPEHLDAFDPTSGVSPAEVDERSDVYSLGIVIYELLTGGRPFDDPKRSDNRTQFIRSLSASRRVSPPPLDESLPSARKTLLRTISKSLAGEKQNRFQTGAEFAAALDGCRELQRAAHELPRLSWLSRGACRWPFVWLVLLALGPQFVGSAVNISYNFVEIVGNNLNAQQADLFLWPLVPVYNLIVYPVLIAVGVYAVAPVFVAWRRLHGSKQVSEEQVRSARARALQLPYWMLAIAAAGWLPGGLLFPWLLDRYLDDPVSTETYAHFLTSFSLSGLIAVAYSFCGLQFLVIQVLYPRLWSDPSHYRLLSKQELAGTPFRLRLINVLSGAIPFLAAVVIGLFLYLLIDEEGNREAARDLVVLLVSLVLLGGLGREITTTVTSRIARAYNALLGSAA